MVLIAAIVILLLVLWAVLNQVRLATAIPALDALDGREYTC